MALFSQRGPSQLVEQILAEAHQRVAMRTVACCVGVFREGSPLVANPGFRGRLGVWACFPPSAPAGARPKRDWSVHQYSQDVPDPVTHSTSLRLSSIVMSERRY